MVLLTAQLGFVCLRLQHCYTAQYRETVIFAMSAQGFVDNRRLTGRLDGNDVELWTTLATRAIINAAMRHAVQFVTLAPTQDNVRNK